MPPRNAPRPTPGNSRRPERTLLMAAAAPRFDQTRPGCGRDSLLRTLGTAPQHVLGGGRQIPDEGTRTGMVPPPVRCPGTGAERVFACVPSELVARLPVARELTVACPCMATIALGVGPGRPTAHSPAVRPGSWWADSPWFTPYLRFVTLGPAAPGVVGSGPRFPVGCRRLGASDRDLRRKHLGSSVQPSNPRPAACRIRKNRLKPAWKRSPWDLCPIAPIGTYALPVSSFPPPAAARRVAYALDFKSRCNQRTRRGGMPVPPAAVITDRSGFVADDAFGVLARTCLSTLLRWRIQQSSARKSIRNRSRSSSDLRLRIKALRLRGMRG